MTTIQINTVTHVYMLKYVESKYKKKIHSEKKWRKFKQKCYLELHVIGLLKDRGFETWLDTIRNC